MYKRLLVPLDGSEVAEKALPYAVKLARKLSLEIILLHVCATGPSVSFSMCKAYIEQLAGTAGAGGRQGSSKGAAPVAIKGVAIEGRDVPSAILEFADKRQADLILLSRCGQSGKGRWSTGSVAHKVLTASRVPVLVVHPQAAGGAPGAGWPRTVLVLLDGSKLSETVLSHVESIFSQNADGGTMTLFEVCEPPDLLSDYPESAMALPWDEHVKRARASSEKVCSTRLVEIQSRLQARGRKVAVEVALGDNVIDEIVKYIEGHDFDLVAMTTHGRSGISQWPYGHVADRIVQVSSTPILLVRPSKAA